MLSFTPSELVSELELCIQADTPLHIWGAPGIGKSQIVQQVAKKLGRELTDLRAVLLDPIDLRGLPSVSGDVTRWIPPVFLPRKGPGILFLDELTAAPQMTQAACYSLILDHRLGEYLVPDDVYICAAGNPASERGVHFQMPRPLRSRFSHAMLVPDLAQWCQWAVANRIPPHIIAYLRFRPEHLCMPGDLNENTWPSPRTWEFAARKLAAWLHNGGSIKDPRLLKTLAGTIGDAVAGELVSFIQMYMSLPSTDEIVLNPTSAPVPTEPSSAIAIATALGKAMTDTNIVQIDKYLKRMRPEMHVMAMRDASERDRSITKTSAFVEYAVLHQQKVA